MNFAQWKQGHFSQLQLLNSAVSGDCADPNANGIINLLEYAFNMDPLTDEHGSALGDGKGMPQVDIVRISNQDYVAIRYVRRKAPSDLTYVASRSETLPLWTTEIQAPALFQMVDQQDLGEVELVRVRSTVPMSGAGALSRNSSSVLG